MSTTLTLPAEKRSIIGKANKQLRRAGSLPAVLYGHGVQAMSVQVPYNSFERIFRDAGESTIVELLLDGASTPVLIQDVQIHPTSGQYLHADFHTIRMDEKITTDTELRFIGEAPAVTTLGGSLFHGLSTVKIECLPKDLPSHLTIDVSGLKEFTDHIAVTDIPVPNGVRILDAPDSIVASVTPPRSEEELAALEEKPAEDIEAVEVEKKGKKEEEGAEPGAAAAPDTGKAETPAPVSNAPSAGRKS